MTDEQAAELLALARSNAERLSWIEAALKEHPLVVAHPGTPQVEKVRHVSPIHGEVLQPGTGGAFRRAGTLPPPTEVC